MTRNPYPAPAPEREKVLRRLPYGTVEAWSHEGRVTEGEWDWFSWEWRNSAVRFSSLAASYEARIAGMEGG